MRPIIVVFVLIVCSFKGIDAQKTYSIENKYLSLKVSTNNKMLIADTLTLKPNNYGFKSEHLVTDADFGIDLIWTGWRAPEMPNNSQGRLLLTKNDFEIEKVAQNSNEIIVDFKGKNSTLLVSIKYSLSTDNSFVHKYIAIKDTIFGHHFLHAIYPVKSNIKLEPLKATLKKVEVRVEGSDDFSQVDNLSDISTSIQIVKKGGYGQIAAIRSVNSSTFFGLENPASDNHIKTIGSQLYLECSKPYGVIVDNKGIESEAVVIAINPEPYVKKWYWSYIDKIRIAPDTPYTLYNSWYDLRSVEYPRVPEQHWMNEKNVERLIDKVHQNMTVENGIEVDAFVLDDGWDIYTSDWKMRTEQFPHGLSSLSKKLLKNNTKLGAWFGPMGGYSFRMKRINWMIQNGYEGLDNEYEYCAAFMCVGGKKYNSMFGERVVDMIENNGVRYFKWDGMIFSCNDPTHGHRTGLYSTVSILDEFGKICDKARATAPDVYLNLTTGTWLSPWWLRYANQIWMDGADYAFANVPSLSKRDNAITYRDFVLYDDLINKDLWFPVSNLMTHGLIKGKLDHVGTNNEPLDKLTDDAVLYVARGVSMYELYISPDILTKDEWSVISQTLKWARNRHNILRRTEMIGGNPTLAEPYGYAHFYDNKGVVALRNPNVGRQTITLELSPEYGLDRCAESLVIEQVYPYRYIFPNTYSSGATLNIDLNSFETAVFEIYPLDSARHPLLAGVVFNGSVTDNEYKISIFGSKGNAKILNYDIIKNSGWEIPIIKPVKDCIPQIVNFKQTRTKKGIEIYFEINTINKITDFQLGLLLKNAENKDIPIPIAQAVVNGKESEIEIQEQKNRWGWRVVNLEQNKNIVKIVLSEPKTEQPWNGEIELWAFGFENYDLQEISIPTNNKSESRPMPPCPWPKSTLKISHKLKQIDIK